MSADFPRISSARNPRLKQAIKLRQPRGRAQQSRILIDGQREIWLALQNGVQIDELFLEVGRASDSLLADWLQTVKLEGVQIWTLPAALFGKLGYGGRSDQPVATARTPERNLSALPIAANPLVVVLEGVEKPGNVGAVVRTADGAGADAVIVAGGRTDLWNPNAVRASRGTIFTLPVCAASPTEVIDWLAAKQIQVCVARVDAEQTYDAMDFCQGTAIVVGSETSGVSQIWRNELFAAIKLPMEGHADSLNVAATAAVLLYEANRQRRRLKRPC